MKFKKSITFFACLCMAGGILSGCGTKETNNANGTDTITIWSVNSHSKDTYERLINDFNKTTGKEKGIKIDYLIKEGSSIVQSLEVALQNGTAPDMFTSGNLKKLSPNGDVLALEDLPGGTEFIEKYKDVLIEEMHTYRGKTYAVPTGATTQGLIYNKEMFRKAGIVDENGEAKPPETFDEMVEVAKKLTNPENKEYGIILPMKWDGWVTSDIRSVMMSAAGHCGFNPATGTYDFSSYAPGINAYLQMKKDGSIYPGAEGIDNDPARALFATGNIGMKMGFSFDVGVLNDQFPTKIDWGVAPYPVLDKDNCYLQQMSLDASFYINAKATEHTTPEKIMEVIKFFTSDNFAREAYKDGVSIPYDWNIVKDVKLDNPKKGWEDFCRMVDISHNYILEPPVDMSGIRKFEDRVIEDVWSGKVTAEDLTADYTKQMNELLEKYKADPSNEPLENFIIRDWNIKR